MPRIIWFALGVLAGGAYATRLIEQDRLELPPGADTTDFEIHNPPVERAQPHAKSKGPGAKEKAARMIEDRSDQLADIVTRQGDRLSTIIAERGQQLADRLRQGKGQGHEQMGVHQAGPVAATDNLDRPQTQMPMAPSARVSPYGTPTIRPETDPSTEAFRQGLEEYRRP